MPPPKKWMRQPRPIWKLHVVGQPDAKRLMKDDAVRFTGTLKGYQQSPFMLTWDNAKVNPEDLQPAPDRRRKAPGAHRGAQEARA